MLLTNYRQLLVKSDTIQDLIQVLKSITYGKDGHGGPHLLFTWTPKSAPIKSFSQGPEIIHPNMTSIVDNQGEIQLQNLLSSCFAQFLVDDETPLCS